MRMPDIEAEARAAVGWTVAHLHHHETTAAPAAATATEEHMSFITDVENGWTTLEAEYGKFKAALPGAIEKAKAFEASPFAALAEKAAGSVLPPEAVAIAVGAAEKVIDDLSALYAPQTPAQPPAA